MSTIESTGAVGQPIIPPLPDDAPRAAPKQADSTGQPGVIVSLSSAATRATTGLNLGEIKAYKVDDVLSSAASANGFAENYRRFDYSSLEKVFGKAIADRDRDGVRQEAALAAGHALSSAAELGISAQASVKPDDVFKGADPGHVTVGNFGFTDGKSTYQITNGPGYTLVGTKDGQPWQTWHLRDPADAARSDAEAALSTLTSLNTRNQPSTVSQAQSRLDVSV